MAADNFSKTVVNMPYFDFNTFEIVEGDDPNNIVVKMCLSNILPYFYYASLFSLSLKLIFLLLFFPLAYWDLYLFFLSSAQLFSRVSRFISKIFTRKQKINFKKHKPTIKTGINK